MAESLAYKVSETTNSFLKQASFIFASTTEVITIDYKPWLSLHVYFCHKEKWSCKSILLMLKQVMEDNNAQVVKEAIPTTLTWHDGLDE
jgi:hypothetical protein